MSKFFFSPWDIWAQSFDSINLVNISLNCCMSFGSVFGCVFVSLSLILIFFNILCHLSFSLPFGSINMRASAKSASKL